MPRAPRRYNAVPKSLIHQLLAIECDRRGTRANDMRISAVAVQMLQAEGESFMVRLFQKLLIIMNFSGQQTVLLRHLRILQALQGVDSVMDASDYVIDL